MFIMRRLFRILFRCGLLLALLALAGLALYVWALPAVVTRQLQQALVQAGYPNCRFELTQVTPRRAVITNLRLNEAGTLILPWLEARYDWRGLQAGRVETLRLTGGQLRLQVVDGALDLSTLLPTTSSSTSSGALPISRIVLEACRVEVLGLPVPVRVDLNAALTSDAAGLQGQAELSAGGLTWRADVAHDPATGRLLVKLAPQLLAAREHADWLRCELARADAAAPLTLQVTSAGMSPGVGQWDFAAAGPLDEINWQAKWQRAGTLALPGGVTWHEPQLAGQGVLRLAPNQQQFEWRVDSVTPMRGSVEAATLTLGQVHFGGTAQQTSTAATPTNWQMDARLQIADAAASVPSASGWPLQLAGMALDLPLRCNQSEKMPGSLTIAIARVGKLALPALQGTVSLDDGVLSAAADWPITPAAALHAALNYALATQTGQVQLELPPTSATEGLFGELLARTPTLASMQVTGQVGLTGIIDLAGTQLRPQLALRLTDLALASQQYDLRCTGGNGTITFDNLWPPRTPSQQRLNFALLHLGTVDLQQGELALRIDHESNIFLERMRWRTPEDGTLAVHALRLDPSERRLSFDVYVENLPLQPYLDKMDLKRVATDGRFYGRIPLTIDLDRKQRFALGDGYLFSAPGKARLQITDSTWLSEVLAQGGSPLVTDPKLAQVRRNLFEALSDLEYSMLRLDLIPGPDGVNCRVVTTGVGVRGQRQEIGSLTVNFRGLEQAFNSLVLLQLGSEKALDQALERFFPR